MNAIFQKILSLLLWLLLIFAAAILILAVAAQSGEGGIPSILGRYLIAVRTSSMEPVIRPGDLIVSEVLTAEEKRALCEGDIITFYADLDGDGDWEINTHRIIAVRQDAASGRTEYVTRGENNLTADEKTVSDQQVIGRYSGFRLGGVGQIMMFLQSSVVFFCCILLPLMLFCLYAAWNFVRKLMSLGRDEGAADNIKEGK